MRKAKIYNHGILAGLLIQNDNNQYQFIYQKEYGGPPISLTMPLEKQKFTFDFFPPFFDGLLPEGIQLEALLKKAKIDRYDFLTQLITVGSDLVGSVTVEGAD